MNDETAQQTYQEDDTPTKPVGKPADGWVMPEPVFRKSSGGSLPRRLGLGPEGRAEATIPAAIEDSRVTDSVPVAAAPKSAATVPIAEQPDLSGELSTPEDAVPVAAAKQRSGLAKVLLIVLGLAGILFLVAVFLVVIYYLFFYRTGESQTF